MSYYGVTITDKGRELIAKLAAGKKLTISEVQVGSGKCSDDQQPEKLDALVHFEAKATSTNPLYNGSTVQFVVEYRNDLNNGLKEGFWLSEFGVFAKDPDVGKILLYYGCFGDYPQYVNALSKSAIDVRRFPVTIVIGKAEGVEVEYNCGAWMTAEDVASYCADTLTPQLTQQTKSLIEAHNNSPEAHQTIRDSVTELDTRIDAIDDLVTHDKGYYPTAQALQSAHSTAMDGDHAIVGETDTIWVWDSDTSAWTNSGNKTDLSNYFTKDETTAALAKKADTTALTAHENKKNNPHGVTAEQVGAVSSVNGQTGAVTLSATDVGAVSSVNTKTGAVVLAAKDVGALPITGGTLTGPVSVNADTVDGTNRAYIGVQNSTGGTWVSLTSSADGSVSVYSSTKNKALVSMNAEGTVYLGGVAGPFLPISGGTLTGSLYAGERLQLYTSTEGGNIRIIPPDDRQTTNKYWEIDAYNGNIRIYANTSAGTNVAALTLNSTESGTQLNGNAATATKLATARTINNVEFDGTKNITVNVGTDNITASAVTEAKIASSAVTAGKIGTGAVTTAKIADGAVTPAKANLIKYGTKVPTGSDITAGQIYIQYS